MYLDTDIILALIKEDDWLKKYVNISKLKSAKTSVITIIEARIVLEREYSRNEAIKVLSKLKKFNMQILPIDDKIIEKSQELLEKYPRLNIFDSIHVACAIINNEIIISTDTIFSSINELKSKDPRKL